MHPAGENPEAWLADFRFRESFDFVEPGLESGVFVGVDWYENVAGGDGGVDRVVGYGYDIIGYPFVTVQKSVQESVNFAQFVFVVVVETGFFASTNRQLRKSQVLLVPSLWVLTMTSDALTDATPESKCNLWSTIARFFKSCGYKESLWPYFDTK